MPTHAATDCTFYAGDDLESLADLPHYHGWILRHFAPHLRGRVLEVGAGIGNFSARFVDRVDEAVLLEPAENLVPALAARFAACPQVRTVCGSLTDGGMGSAFDAVVMVNVLEHIADDHATVRRAAELLRPGGKLLLFVPALPWLYGSLDAAVQHERRYSCSRLRRVLGRAGLHVVSLRRFDAAGVLPWLLAGRVLRQRRFSAAAARFYDRVVVPLMAPVERLLPMPLGKNLICVAERPAVSQIVKHRVLASDCLDEWQGVPAV